MDPAQPKKLMYVKKSQNFDQESQETLTSRTSKKVDQLNPMEDLNFQQKNIEGKKQKKNKLNAPFCAVCKKPSNINCDLQCAFSYCSNRCKNAFLSQGHSNDCFAKGQQQEKKKIQKEMKQREKLNKQGQEWRKKNETYEEQEIQLQEQIKQKYEEQERKPEQKNKVILDKQKIKVNGKEYFVNALREDLQKRPGYTFTDSQQKETSDPNQNSKKQYVIVKPNCENCKMQSKINCECLSISYCSKVCKIQYQQFHTFVNCQEFKQLGPNYKQQPINQFEEPQQIKINQNLKPPKIFEELKSSFKQESQNKNQENQQRGIGGFRGKMNNQKQNVREQIAEQKIEQQIDSKTQNYDEKHIKKQLNDFYRLINQLKESIKNRDLKKYCQDLQVRLIQSQVRNLFEKNNPLAVEDKLLVFKIVFSLLKNLVIIQWEEQLKILVDALLKEKLFFQESINFFRDLVQQQYNNQNQQNEKNKQVISMVQDLSNWTLINEKLLDILPDFEIGYLAGKQIYNFSQSIKSIVEEQQTFSVTDNEKKLQKNYQVLIENAQKVFQKIQEMTEKQEGSDDSETQDEIPVDFRHMSIIPTISDLNDKQDPKLREIQQRGEFKNLEIYLDSNFRLLREDFMKDLRDGFQMIQKSDQNQSKKEENSMHLLVSSYKSARIFGVFAAKQFFGLRIQIQTGQYFQRSWTKSKKLQYGQLVLFSDDLFKQKIYFGIIRENNGEENDQSHQNYGHITIYVEIIEEQINNLNAFDIYEILKGKEICLIESKSYFEAYVHVLKCLQDTDSNRLKHFQKMIIKVDKSYNRIPDLWFSEKMQLKIAKFAKDNNLDEMQSKAFKTAFSYNISLIQGPPGTGKTFVGEKIVDFMLKNLRTKNGLQSGPILLTCYTNHALDQFLEKILLKTQNVIRLGGNSRNESFSQYSIIEMKKKNKAFLPKQYWNYKKNLEGYLIQFEDINKTFIKVCNMPIITTVDQIREYQQIFLNTFKNFIEDGFNIYESNNDSYDSQEQELDDIILQIIDWVQQAQKSFDYEFEKIKSIYNPQNQLKYQELVVQKACFCGNAHILRWLGILDLDSMKKKIKEKEEVKKQEYDENDYEDQDYGDNYFNKMYQEKFQEIQNYSEYSYSLYKFLNQTLFINENNKKTYQQIFELKNNQYGTGSENYYQKFQDLIIRISKNKLPNDYDKIQEQDKWLLNFGLIDIIRNDCNQRLQRLTKNIMETKTLIDQIIEIKDIQILQKMDVIAMTTTGAAKYKKILQQISSKIMVVEEAAEILESHIFTSLNPDIQQLVLIGDHQQLRPSLNAFELAEYYNLDLSMFERLINNNFDYARLSQQRRMRPEISQIIKQIYPELEDSETVFKRPLIRGLNNKNYFFFDHIFPEETIQRIQTKSNQKEAEMIVEFYNYLLQQKYKPEQITILSLYTGQLLKLREIINKRFKEHEHRSVLISTVDNYQGEENDIILLSLVRSNNINQIGFLKVSNRICVALSRARNGMYIFGNQKCLQNATNLIDERKNKALQKNDEYAIYSEHLWKKVLKLLQSRKDIGDKIILQCKHDTKFYIGQPNDFKQCKNGGCSKPCGQLLECRHICQNLCHYYEQTKQDKTGHDDYKCMFPCERTRTCGHKCLKKCFDCKNGQFEQHKEVCGYIIELKLNCKHVMQVECHQRENPALVKCKKNCDRVLECGHKCQKICSMDCNFIYDSDKKRGYLTPCKKEVQRMLECGHSVLMDCGQNIRNVQCKECS